MPILLRNPGQGVHPTPLDERSKQILALERTWWQEPGSKREAIRRRFGLSPTRYYELVGELIDSPEALSYDPLVVKRLRRGRTVRRRQRFFNDLDARR